MSFLIILFALGIVIFIHEMGHLLAAKLSGVGVYEFAVGMGPRVFSFTKSGTIYSLRAFPLGGFVKLMGMDDESEEDCDPDKDFNKKPILNRFITIAAGSVMNIILGFFIFLFIFLSNGIPQASSVIEKVFPDYPASEAGLLPGDRILALNGKNILDFKKDLLQPIKQSSGSEIRLDLQRGEQRLIVDVSPRNKGAGESAVIGVQFKSEMKSVGFFEAVPYAFRQTGVVMSQIFQTLKLLITGNVSVKDLAGPVGIVQWASFELKGSFIAFLGFMALISINLGVINLFPFPVLDGGHLLFLLIEVIIRRPVPAKIMQWSSQIGAVILIALMCFVIFNDVINWQSRLKFFEGLTP